MKAIELLGSVDEQHRLRAQVPEEVPSGPVRLMVFLPEEDEAGWGWARGAAAEWADDLNDPHQDLYTLEDGRPVNESR